MPPQPRCSPLGLASLPGARLQRTSTWGRAVPAVRPRSVGFPGQHVLRGIIRELAALPGLSSPERRVLTDGLPREPPAVSAAPVGLGSSWRGRAAPGTCASERPQLPARRAGGFSLHVAACAPAASSGPSALPAACLQRPLPSLVLRTPSGSSSVAALCWPPDPLRSDRDRLFTFSQETSTSRWERTGFLEEASRKAAP